MFHGPTWAGTFSFVKSEAGDGIQTRDNLIGKLKASPFFIAIPQRAIVPETGHIVKFPFR